MDFNEKINVAGRLEVIQINNKTGEETVLFDDHNVITGGLGQSIAHMMATRGCTLEPCLPESVRFGPRTSDSSVGTTNSLNETRTGGVNPPASNEDPGTDKCYLIFEGTVTIRNRLLGGGQNIMTSKIKGNWHCECFPEGTEVGEFLHPPLYGGWAGGGSIRMRGRPTIDSNKKGFKTDVYSIKRTGQCWTPKDLYGNQIYICEGAGEYEEELNEVVTIEYLNEVTDAWRACYDEDDWQDRRSCQQHVLNTLTSRFAGVFYSKFTGPPEHCDGTY